MSNTPIVLPRPRIHEEQGDESPIQAPSEAAFVATFGNILPNVSFVHTMYGKTAYYSLPPSSPAPADRAKPISRVLFVHGVQTPAIGMQPLASALRSRFPYAHLVLFDLYGHGLSDTPIVSHDPIRFRFLITALMMHLDWEDAHFVGYSFGGSTVAIYAAFEPERVLSMSLVAPAGLLRTSELCELEKSYMRGGEGLEERAREWILEFLEGGKLAVPSDWKERVGRGEVVAEAVRDWQMRKHKGHAASVVGIFRDGGVFDQHAEFAKAAKTGIKNVCVFGELDDLCSVQDLHDVGMQNVAVVPQVGHGVVRERVPEVAELIENFWKKIENGE